MRGDSTRGDTTTGTTTRGHESTVRPGQTRFSTLLKNLATRFRYYRLKKRPLIREPEKPIPNERGFTKPTVHGLTYTENERLKAELKAKEDLREKRNNIRQEQERAERLRLQEQERIRLAEQKRLRGRR